jgi:hypothetical protein
MTGGVLIADGVCNILTSPNIFGGLSIMDYTFGSYTVHEGMRNAHIISVGVPQKNLPDIRGIIILNEHYKVVCSNFNWHFFNLWYNGRFFEVRFAIDWTIL